MQSIFFVDYDVKRLSLFYNNGLYEFDLNEGDIGDFWHTLTDKYGKQYDINFCVDHYDRPTLSVYKLRPSEGGGLEINTSDFESIKYKGSRGNLKQYLK